MIRCLSKRSHVPAYSPNSCLQHGVLALNLLMPLGPLSFSLQRRSRYLSAKLQCRSKSRFFLHRLDLKIVLWLQPGSKLRTASFWSSIPGAWGLKVLLWLQPYSKSRTAPPLSEPRYRQNYSKTSGFISFLKVPLFCLGASSSSFLQKRQVS